MRRGVSEYVWFGEKDDVDKKYNLKLLYRLLLEKTWNQDLLTYNIEFITVQISAVSV